MSYGIIYKATNMVNGKVYIGQTTKELEERVSEHKRKRNTKGFKWVYADKYDGDVNV